jgi:hypothetical protein
MQCALKLEYGPHIVGCWRVDALTAHLRGLGSDRRGGGTRLWVSFECERQMGRGAAGERRDEEGDGREEH